MIDNEIAVSVAVITYNMQRYPDQFVLRLRDHKVCDAYMYACHEEYMETVLKRKVKGIVGLK